MVATLFPYKLFHGTSSHYSAAFPIGGVVSAWPYKKDALGLYREIWKELCLAGIEPDWTERGVLEERSNGGANWQHGELFVSPSRKTAKRYATSWAEHGGELLSRSVLALDRLKCVNPDVEGYIRRRFKPLAHLLAGGGSPLMVEFTGAAMAGLSPESLELSNRENRMRLSLDYLEGAKHLSEDDFDQDTQQINFRLDPGAAIIAHLYKIGEV